MGAETWIGALEEAFTSYRRELEEAQSKQRPTDGLFGVGHSLKDDVCHDRFDRRVEEAVGGLCALPPSPEEAEKALRLLLCPRQDRPWPLSAQWMLRAAERHALPLIPFLEPASAGTLLREYGARYRPWDRLPAQREVYDALKKKEKK